MRTLIFFLTLTFLSIQLSATHVKSGYITYQQINNLTYKISVITYSDQESVAYRDSLSINIRTYPLYNSIGYLAVPVTKTEELTKDITKSTYSGTYTFPGDGKYSISMSDPNRVDNITNVTGSVNVPMFLESIATVIAAASYNSVKIRSTPLLYLEENETVHHTINAFDPDGDCLRFDLVSPRQKENIVVPGYTKPGSLNLDNHSGDLEADILPGGKYLFTVKIEEIRNGQIVGVTFVDYLIQTVSQTLTYDFTSLKNFPNPVNGFYKIYLKPGDTLDLKMNYFNESSANLKSFVAYGDALELQTNPASFSVTPITSDSMEGHLYWTPTASNVRSAPYIFSVQGHSLASIAGDSLPFQKNITIMAITDSAGLCSIVTSVEAIPEFGLKITPNPMTHRAVLQFNNLPAEPYDVFLYDLNGRMVRSYLNNTESALTIERGALPAGIYIYRIGVDHETGITGKIVVQ